MSATILDSKTFGQLSKAPGGTVKVPMDFNANTLVVVY